MRQEIRAGTTICGGRPFRLLRCIAAQFYLDTFGTHEYSKGLLNECIQDKMQLIFTPASNFFLKIQLRDEPKVSFKVTKVFRRGRFDKSNSIHVGCENGVHGRSMTQVLDKIRFERKSCA